ncbi:MAG: DUF2914 domain-containing protein [Elusimicrobia bacterium]|nr:DUF2914 domain-containing protein [Elusimicrobiota bacterium]
MKKLFIATLLAAVSGYLYAQTPAAETKAAPAPLSGIKVEKIVTAYGVEKKEPVNETSAFDKDTAKVYTWTKITAATTPARIKHVYYLNEKKAAEVELQIGGSPWRVWSAKIVRPGSWKVEVTDENDAVLSTIVFTVADTAKAETPTQAPAPGK